MFDVLRLAVDPADPANATRPLQVQIFVNDTEMTAAGAGMGMDPYDVLIPTNRFLPGTTSHTFGAARCDCGTYGCGSTDITVTADGDVVHWDWLIERPMDRRVTFELEPYLAEVERMAADHSWESPQRTLGRLVREREPADILARRGLHVAWVANEYRDPRLFTVCLTLGVRRESLRDGHEGPPLSTPGYQVFLRFPWEGRSPEELAAAITDHLGSDPQSWTATWHGTRRDAPPPSIAGGTWSRERIP
jgi:hypothetical protein